MPVPYDYNEDDDEDDDEEEEEEDRHYNGRMRNVYLNHSDYKRRTPYQVATGLPTMPSGYGCADENAFKRWLSSRPHWKIPRTRPSGWISPWASPPAARVHSRRQRSRHPPVVPPVIPVNQLDSVPIIPEQQARTPFAYAPAGLPGMPGAATATPYAYAPFLPAAAVGYPTPAATYPPLLQATPHGYVPVLPHTNQACVTMMTPAATPYRHIAASMPFVTPATVNYGLPPPAVQVATPAIAPALLGTPGVHYQWVAHPFPHPTIPAQQFFQQVPVVPVTWTPGQLQLVTGGLPAPGTAPAWCAENYQAQGPTAFTLSAWLAPNPRNASVPHILWDASVESPACMRRLTVRGLIVDFANTPQFNDALAVKPAQRALVLSVSPGCDALWGPVGVEERSEGAGVKVADVYWALHRYLHKQVTEDDMSRIYAADGGKDRYKRMEYACWRRCMDAQAIPGAMASEGLKRVDFLEGSTIFWGMWCRRDENGSIYLCVGFCPPWM